LKNGVLSFNFHIQEVLAMGILGAVVRFVISTLVLMVVSWVVRGFQINGFWSAAILALVIAGLAYLLESIVGRKITPFGRGIVGFIISALIIWVAQFIVPGVSTTFIGAILAALIIGIIDLFVPVKTPFDYANSWKYKDRK
jgi:putative membrane protein